MRTSTSYWFSIILLISGLLSFKAIAQQGKPPFQKEFLDADFLVLPSEAGAVYWRETEPTTKAAGVRKTHFLNGMLQGIESYENLRKLIPHGVSECWDENGQLVLHREFRHGRTEGEFRTYYPSGQLRRQENYLNGKLLAGKCFGPDGTSTAFFAYEIMPVYTEGDGGFPAILAAVARNFRYPDEALRAHTTGRVLIGFVITNQGLVADVHIMQGLSAVVDAEALRAVQQLKPFVPAKQDGDPIAAKFTVPITLSIK